MKNAASSTRLKVLVLTAAAFLLRAYGVRFFPLDLDEMLQYYIACRSGGLGSLLPMLREMPLHAVVDPLIHWLFARVSTELWWLRLAPALLGAACVPALFALARRFGEDVALWTCALLAISVSQVELAGFLDFYPLLVLCALASTALLLSAADDERGRGFAVYAAAMTVFLYSHPWAVLVAALHAVWIAGWKRERLKPFLLAQLAAAVLFLPWVLYALPRLLAVPRSFHFSEKPLLPQALSTFLTWAGKAEREGSYEMTRLHGWAAAAAPLYAALAAFGVWRVRRERRWSPEWSLMALMAAGGPALAMTADRLFSYLYEPRQALFAAPFFLLFVAEGLRGIPRRGPRLAAAGALAALALGTHLELWRQQDARRLQREGMVERVRAAAPGRVLFDEPNFAAMILFHLDRDAFMRLKPPALQGDFYLMGWPEGLSAGGHPVDVVWNPDESPERESIRWREQGEAISSGDLPSQNILFGLMREEPRLKAREWMRTQGTKLAPSPG